MDGGAVSDLPPWALTEEQFVEWCSVRGFDETDETFAEFEAWLDGDR